MQQYLEVLRTTLEHGHKKGDRTNTGTTAFFGMQKRFQLHKAFKPVLPTVTTKFIHLDSVIHELIWMLSGDTRLEYLIANGVRIWNEWVLKGTEVYRDLTYDEMEKAILKFVGGKHLVTFHAIPERPATEITHVNDYKEVFNAEPPKLDDGVELILSVNTLEYSKYRDEVEHLDYSEQYMYIIHSMLIGKPQKLIGGDLGPVYGKTWRDIDDTRIIPKLEWYKFEQRGFTFVVDLPGTDMESDRCVITRKVDQLKEVLHLLEHEPDSRRMIICAWDPRLIQDQALPPCHAFIQFFTRELSAEERLDYFHKMEEGRLNAQLEAGIVERGAGPSASVEAYLVRLQLWRKETLTNADFHKDMDDQNIPKRAISCMLTQRSADEFLGVPFNISFYSLMTHLLASQFNMVAEEFIWSGGDCHIYSNHMEQVDLQLTREPYDCPDLSLMAPGKDIREIVRGDVFVDYLEYHPHIAGKVAV